MPVGRGWDESVHRRLHYASSISVPNFEHLENSVEDVATVDAQGMYMMHIDD